MTDQAIETEESDSNLVLIIGLLMAGFLVGLGVAAVIDGAEGWRAFALAGVSAIAGVLVGSCFVLGKPQFKAWSLKMEVVAEELKIEKRAKVIEREKMEAMQYQQHVGPTVRQIAFANRLGIEDPEIYDREELSEQIDFALEVKRSKQR